MNTFRSWTIAGTRLLSEILFSLRARPLTVFANVVITALGVGGLVATVGLVVTASGEIGATLDKLATSTVLVSPNPQGPDGPATITADSTIAIEALEGVNSAVVVSTRPSPTEAWARNPLNFEGASRNYVDVIGATERLAPATQMTLSWGVPFDVFHHESRSRVALVGTRAASRLGLQRVDGVVGISVGGNLLSVLGVVSSAPGKPALADAVIVPLGLLRDLYGPGTTELVVRVEPGYAGAIASAAPLAASPQNPSGLLASIPPQFVQQRRQVDSNLAILLFVSSGVLIGIGVLSISITKFVAVSERSSEIGLRRALGAGRLSIAVQFLAESVAVGFLGGVLGAAVGSTVVVAVSASEGWGAYASLWPVIGGPIVGAGVGAVAGLVPAGRAVMLEPSAALRRSIEI